MRDELRTAVRDTWERALDEERTVSVPAVVDRVIATHRALYGREMERLGRAALVRWVKDLARAESDADGQLSLFGLPAVIALPDPADADSYVYMRTPRASWPDVQAGRALRIDNLRRAQARLDAYDGALDVLRPVMEGTDLTLEEAVRSLRPEPTTETDR